MKKYNEDYLKFIASFMMALVISLPFYISDAFAQNLPDPVQSCIEKNEKNNEFVELLENDVINYLERILSLLHTISSIWEASVVILDTLILIGYSNPLSAIEARLKEQFRIAENTPAAYGMMFLRYLVTCQLPEGLPTACNFAAKFDIGGTPVSLNAFDNLWVATGCLCLPGVLFNLRKLETVYKTHNCCVQQACENGISMEACDREFEKGICMTIGSGSIMSTSYNMVLSIASGLIMKYLIAEYGKEITPKIGTIISLAGAGFRIQSLIQSFEKITKTFDEPNCKDLGFDVLENLEDN